MMAAIHCVPIQQTAQSDMVFGFLPRKVEGGGERGIEADGSDAQIYPFIAAFEPGGLVGFESSYLYGVAPECRLRVISSVRSKRQ